MASPHSPALPATPPIEDPDFPESRLEFLDHPLLRAHLNAPTPPKTPEVLSERPLSSEAILPAQHDFEASQMSDIPAAAKKTAVNLVRAIEPPVTYTQIFLFVIWMFAVFFQQVWRDLKSMGWYRPLLSSDFMTHYFVSPSSGSWRFVQSQPISSIFQRDALIHGL